MSRFAHLLRRALSLEVDAIDQMQDAITDILHDISRHTEQTAGLSAESSRDGRLTSVPLVSLGWPLPITD